LDALLQAELELCETDANRIAYHEEQVKRMNDLEKTARRECEAGRRPAHEYLRIKVKRLDAEIALWRERARNPSPRK
jgi:hypothetical protein